MPRAIPRLPVASGHSGTVEAGLGLMPGLDADRPVAWFRGSATPGDAEVVRRTVATGVEAGLPVVGVLQGAGADIASGMDGLVGLGQVARALAGAAGLVPTVIVVDGPCLGGVALALGLVDVVVMTERAHAFVNTPGSSARVTGTDRMAHLLDHLPANNHEAPPFLDTDDPADRPSARAAAAVPHDGRASYDVRTVIEDVLDDGAFLELRPRFGTSVTTGLGRIAGMPIGVLANQPNQLAGALDIEGSQKGGRFVRFCDAFGLPILTFVDTPGFRPGRDQEWRGMIRHGAKLAFAYAEATVPRVSVVLRKAYGGAFIVMDCKSMGNDCALAWPTAEIAVMGAKGAGEILHRRELAAAATEEERDARRAKLEAEYEAVHLAPTTAAERGYVDEVIEPADTRRAVAAALRALATKRERLPARRHDNIPL